jgi:hypothetical protein
MFADVIEPYCVDLMSMFSMLMHYLLHFLGFTILGRPLPSYCVLFLSLGQVLDCFGDALGIHCCRQMLLFLVH